MSSLKQLKYYESLLKGGAEPTIRALRQAKTTADIDSDETWGVLVSAYVLSPDTLASETKAQCLAVRGAVASCAVMNDLLTHVADEFIRALVRDGQVGTRESVDGLVELSCMHESLDASGQTAIDEAIGCFSADVALQPELFVPLTDLAEDWILTLDKGPDHITDQFLRPLAGVRRDIVSPEQHGAQLKRTTRAVKETVRKFIEEDDMQDNVIDLKAWADRFRGSTLAGARDFADDLDYGDRRAAAAEEDAEWGSISQNIVTAPHGEDWVLYVEYTYSKIKMTYDGPKEQCPTSVGLGERYFRVDSTEESDNRFMKTWAGPGNAGLFWAQFKDGSVYADAEFDRSLFEFLDGETH